MIGAHSDQGAFTAVYQLPHRRCSVLPTLPPSSTNTKAEDSCHSNLYCRSGSSPVPAYNVLFWPVEETNQRRIRDWRCASLSTKHRCFLFLARHVDTGIIYGGLQYIDFTSFSNAICGKLAFRYIFNIFAIRGTSGKALNRWAALSRAALWRIANNSLTANLIIGPHQTF